VGVIYCAGGEQSTEMRSASYNATFVGTVPPPSIIAWIGGRSPNHCCLWATGDIQKLGIIGLIEFVCGVVPLLSRCTIKHPDFIGFGGGSGAPGMGMAGTE